MPSPFPGMDPYLEEPGLWPDFHNALAAEIRNALNQRLPPAYYAQLELRTEMGVFGDAPRSFPVPDVGVQRMTRGVPSSAAGGVAVLESPRTVVSPSVEVGFFVEPMELASIAVRDRRQGRKLITLLEIVSPSNKRPGRDSDAYTKKLLGTLASDSSLVEIDLLRTGERTWSRPEFNPNGTLLLPESDYLVTVSRAWQRGEHFRLEAFPVPATEALPVISVPLLPADEETLLDLQHCFRLAYDGGPYRRGAVDYGKPPDPPLPLSIQEWARTIAAGAMPPTEP
ncbi:MAG: DUF4058 family protein [Planctomycetaceae bacterium]|nr:DUF4058 family protein [Planctomycetaceae bacterium]